MKLKFDATLEEAVEPGYRMAELLGTVRKTRWIGIALAPLVFGSIYALMHLMSGSGALNLGYSALATVLYLVLHLMRYKRRLRAQIRKVMRKALPTDQPIPCEYEVDESGLVFRKLGQELRFSWGNVVQVSETATAIEVIMDPLGIAIIPKRVFEGPDEMMAWLRFIEEHKPASTHP